MGRWDQGGALGSRDVRDVSPGADSGSRTSRRMPWREGHPRREIDGETSPNAAVARSWPRSFSHATSHAASIAFFGFLPVLTLATLFADWSRRGIVAVDFRQFYFAAEAVVHGANPYPSAADALTAWAHDPHHYPYPYPPLPALLATPLTTLPLEAAGLLVMTALVAVALAIPLVLGVRDWRCYGLVLLWPPMVSAIQTSNPTLVLALAAALAWRFRGRSLRVGTILGLTLAMKFFLWPLVVWLAATRRLMSAVIAGAAGAVLLLISWAAIGFSGFLSYPALLRAADEAWAGDAYSIRNIALDFGASPFVARAVWLTLGLALLVAVVLMGRNADHRTTFILAMAAALALSPLVWLQYFAFLVVVVAVAQPRLGILWFVPFLMFVSPSGHPTPFEASWTLGAAAITFALALHATRAPISESVVFVRRHRPAVAPAR